MRPTGVTTIAVGLITQSRQAEAIVASGQADIGIVPVIEMARQAGHPPSETLPKRTGMEEQSNLRDVG